MLKYLISMLLVLTFIGAPSFANDIYITQSGDNLDLDITQDGQDNEFGDSTTDASLTGDLMTFSITQTGNFNKIDIEIDGNNYTGTWAFTGDNNIVDFTCDATSGVNCETVTANITTNGDDNEFEIYIGETSDSEDLIANFTITGDNSQFINNIDGTDANVTVVSNNSASLATTSVNSDEGNVITLDLDGNGDVNGHTITLNITGGGSTYNVTQSGIYDNMVDATFNGDSHDVDITQSD